MRHQLYHLTPAIICAASLLALLALFLANFIHKSPRRFAEDEHVDSFPYQASLLIAIGISIPALLSTLTDSVSHLLSEKKLPFDAGLVSQWLIVGGVVIPSIALLNQRDSEHEASLFMFLAHAEGLILLNALLFYLVHQMTSFQSAHDLIASSCLLSALHVVNYCYQYSTNHQDFVAFRVVLLLLTIASYVTCGRVCYAALLKFKKDLHDSVIAADSLVGMLYSCTLQVWLTCYLAFYIVTFDNDIIRVEYTFFCTALNYVLTALALVLTSIYSRRAHQMAAVSENALLLKSIFVRHVSHEIRTPLNTTLLGLKLLNTEMNLRSPSDRSTTSDSIRPYKSPRQGDVSSTSPRTDAILYDLISDIRSSTLTAVDILNDLLLYEKIDGGLASLEKAELGAWDFFVEVLKVFRIQAKSSGIDLEWPENPLEGVFINIDRYKLSQVVRNLVSNALKFSPAGGKVVIQAELINLQAEGLLSPKHSPDRSPSKSPAKSPGRSSVKSNNSSLLFSPGSRVGENIRKSIVFMSSPLRNTIDQVFPTVEMVRFSVSDSGPGISKEDQKRLFHEIVQFNAAKLQAGQGSGLGLWISNSIVKLHGGTIGVYSEGDQNQGSTFYIDIPVSRIGSPKHSEDNFQLQDPSYSRQYLKMLGLSDGKDNNGSPTNNSTSEKESSTHIPRRATNATTLSSGSSMGSIGLRSSSSSIPSGKESFKDSINLRDSNMRDSRKTPTRLETIDAAGEDTVENFNAALDTFSPKLGIAQMEKKVAAAAAVPDKKKHYSKSVLIVDDSATNRKLVNRLLRDKMGSRTEAVNGLDALQKVKEAIHNNLNYDVILMDYQMPEMDGPTATREIRALGFNGVIIGITGNGEDKDIQYFQNSGADAVMVKPLDADVFWSTVCELLKSGSNSPNQA